MSAITTQSKSINLNEKREPETTKTKSPLALRDFRLLWLGEGISLIGDQFYMIALPWLVLQLTGDALAMGSVLALAGIPRALFMLVGGAFTDRFSPRRIMLASNLTRLGLVASLAALVLTGQIAVWMLYAFALAFGLMDAFFFPAQNAIIPRIVEENQLPSANAIIQGTMQLSLFAGPVLAGLLISVLDNPNTAAWFGATGDMTGIGLAFGIDALTFLASAITLWMLRSGAHSPASVDREAEQENVLASIGAILKVVWNDITLRGLFMLIGISNFLIVGPMTIGIPLLADTRFPEGAAAFGILMSAMGGGSLLGIAAAGVLPKPSPRALGVVLGGIFSGLGLGIAALGLIPTTPLAALVTFAMGLANGYVNIVFVTWLQMRTAPEMLGRMMSLLMFASAGLLPISNLLTGALIGLNTVWFFVISGLLMTVIVLVTMRNPELRAMGISKVPAEAVDR
jgi:MFS family permease